MAGKSKNDYSKIDLWVKSNPEASFKDFLANGPKIKLSYWTYRKRQEKVLGRPLSPSMQENNRNKKRSKREGTVDRRSRSVYTTVYSTSLQELKKKDGVTAVSEFIGVMNRLFKLHLELAQIEILGSGVQNIEIRRYSR